jgi:hypothetical protein
MERVGLPIWDKQSGRLAVAFKTIYDTDPVECVASLNVLRRHLRPEARDDWIRRLKAYRPELSVRALAKATHTSKSTAARALEPPTVPSGTSERRGSGRGQDGKSETAEKSTSKPRTPAGQARAIAIRGFTRLLSSEPRETLEDLVKLLEGERVKINAQPLDRRIAWARAYLKALDVDINDLRSDEASL